MKLIVRGLLSALALIAASPERATAQPSDYPNRAVSFIVPFAPGGVTSLFARVLGRSSSSAWASRSSWRTGRAAAA